MILKSYSMKIRFFFLQAIIILSINNSLLATDITEQGKSIFKTRCAACHKIGSVFTGPDLTDVDKRRSVDWIIHFVQSSQTVIKNGNKDATVLFEKFNKIQMPDHPDLKEADIKNIVEYIKEESINIAKNTAPFKTPFISQPDYKPVSSHNYLFITAYLMLVMLLVSVLYFAVHINTIKINKDDTLANIILEDAKAA